MTDSIKDLGLFILDKFKRPNHDMRYLGASSDHAQIERDIMRTLNSLSATRDKAETESLLNVLRGHVLAMHAVRYYSRAEVDEILDKIDKLEN